MKEQAGNFRYYIRLFSEFGNFIEIYRFPTYLTKNGSQLNGEFMSKEDDEWFIPHWNFNEDEVKSFSLCWLTTKEQAEEYIGHKLPD